MEEKDIQNLSPEEIRELKTQYNKAKDILEKVNALSIRYDAAFKAFETRNIDLEKVSGDIRDKSVLIENSRNQASDLVVKIKDDLEKIQASITKIDAASVEFEGVKGRIAGKDGVMDAILSASKGLKDDIEKAKTTAQQRLLSVDEKFAQVQDIVTKVQEAYQGFLVIQAQIAAPNTGLQAILDQSVELQKNTSGLFGGIRTFHEESKSYLEQIKTNKTESDDLKEQVKQSLVKVLSDQEEVKKVTALITDTGFANSFHKREKILRWSAGLWLVVIAISLGGLAGFLYYSFRDIQGVPELSLILYRLTLTSPLLFLIGIATKQYGNERVLNEKYAFKATIATVIKKHMDFLIEVKDKVSLEDSQFIRETLESIYNKPDEEGLKSKEIKELKTLLHEKDPKSNLSEILGDIKELKELFPGDSNTLKSVAELFIKIVK
ncbi:MAG: hypothetical protein AAB900_01100 [Patescibacteria group bacterium]